MSLYTYEPWDLLDRFQQQINQLACAVKSPTNSDIEYSDITTGHWHPAVDIREEHDRFVIMADLPGVEPRDIEIIMDNNLLILKGKRNFEGCDEKETFKRAERVSGKFYRCFRLPDSADAEHIEANSKNGVLQIVLPKHEEIQPRRIEVKS